MRKIIYVLIFSFLLIGNLYPQLTGGLSSVYNSPGNRNDISRYIKSDAQGNMFVAGNTVKSETDRDYLLIKYDMKGKLLWVRNYDGIVQGNDTIRSLFVDARGYVYVTGCSQGMKNLYNAVTIKYDPDGNLIWVQRYKEDLYSFSSGCEVITDINENVYVVGVNASQNNQDCILLKYSPEGDLLFKVTSIGLGGGWGEGTCLALSKDMKNVYVGASIYDDIGQYNFRIIKYDLLGNLIWQKIYDGPGHGNESLTCIGVDKYGFVYVGGNSLGKNTGNDIALLKLNSDGDIIWIQRYDGLSHGTDWTCCMKFDIENNVYLAGGILGIQGHNDAAVLKYNSNGELKWITTFNGQNNWHDCCQGVDIDENLNVYMSGRTCKYGNVESDDIFTVKVDNNGNKLWTKIYDGPDNNADYSSNLVYNKVSKTVFTVGHSFSNNTLYDVILLNYNEKKSPIIQSDNFLGQKIDYKTKLANYPNPFNPVTQITFTIPKDDFVKLSVYDLGGKLTKNLIIGYKKAGNHQVNFDGSNLSSGIYFYTLQTSSDKITNKFILNK